MTIDRTGYKYDPSSTRRPPPRKPNRPIFAYVLLGFLVLLVVVPNVIDAVRSREWLDMAIVGAFIVAIPLGIWIWRSR